MFYDTEQLLFWITLAIAMPSDKKSHIGIQSDETLFSIIEYLFREGQSGVTEIADRNDLSKSVVYNHLQSMVRNGYARKVGTTYILSFKFLSIGGSLRERNHLCRYAIPVIEDLGEESNNMISLIIKEGPYGVFSHITNEWQVLRETVPLGNRYPLHQNSAGKAILSKLESGEVETLVNETGLDQATEHTITDLAELFDEIDEIKSRGYATSRGERVNGVQSVSAALTSPESDTIGAISIASPANRASQTQIPDKHIENVLHAVNEVTLRLEYRDG